MRMSERRSEPDKRLKGMESDKTKIADGQIKREMQGNVERLIRAYALGKRGDRAGL